MITVKQIFGILYNIYMNTTIIIDTKINFRTNYYNLKNILYNDLSSYSITR